MNNKERKIAQVEAILEQEECRGWECENTAVVAVKIIRAKKKYYIPLCLSCGEKDFPAKKKYNLVDLKHLELW